MIAYSAATTYRTETYCTSLESSNSLVFRMVNYIFVRCSSPEILAKKSGASENEFAQVHCPSASDVSANISKLLHCTETHLCILKSRKLELSNDVQYVFVRYLSPEI